MVSGARVRAIALSFPEVVEVPHFKKAAFKVRKKIFATLDAEHSSLAVKLSVTDQDIFSVFDKAVIYAVPNKWGKQGWTAVELNMVAEELIIDILKTAYREVAPVALAQQVVFE